MPRNLEKIEATCPAGHKVTKGQNGWLLVEKTGAIFPDGHVDVKTVTGNTVTVEAPKLVKPVRGAKLRFHVWY
jgi:hypothetical protein